MAQLVGRRVRAQSLADPGRVRSSPSSSPGPKVAKVLRYAAVVLNLCSVS